MFCRNNPAARFVIVFPQWAMTVQNVRVNCDPNSVLDSRSISRIRKASLGGVGGGGGSQFYTETTSVALGEKGYNYKTTFINEKTTFIKIE